MKMINVKIPCLLIAAGLLVATGAGASDVQVTADPKADMSKYATFAFLEPDPKSKGAITDKAVRERLRHLIAQHLNKRGYQPALPGKTAEIGVHFAGHVEAKQRVLMVGRPGPLDYSWGSSEFGGTSTLDYREGRLIVDLVDVSKSQLLWRTHITEALTAGYSEENWKKVDRSLGQAFQKLPARK